jgi:hypothetical protein
MTYPSWRPPTVCLRLVSIDDLVVIPTNGIGKERSDVNSITSMVVAAHLDELLAEAANERLARSAKATSHRPNRIVSAVKSVWSTLNGPADQAGSLPLLADYPYRG